MLTTEQALPRVEYGLCALGPSVATCHDVGRVSIGTECIDADRTVILKQYGAILDPTIVFPGSSPPHPPMQRCRSGLYAPPQHDRKTITVYDVMPSALSPHGQPEQLGLTIAEQVQYPHGRFGERTTTFIPGDDALYLTITESLAGDDTHPPHSTTRGGRAATLDDVLQLEPIMDGTITHTTTWSPPRLVKHYRPS